MKLEKLKQDGTFQNCAVVILAAGQSKRLGHPKQLVVYKGKTLLNRAIETVEGVRVMPELSNINYQLSTIVVVLGAHFDEIKESISNKRIPVLKNENFEEGIASSIRCGLKEIIEKSPNVESVIFLVCDQPFVHSELLLNLISKHKKSGKPLVASQYENILGTPALFHKSYFSELAQLKGDAGAGKLIKQNLSEVAIVQFSNGVIDIDSSDDLKFLL